MKIPFPLFRSRNTYFIVLSIVIVLSFCLPFLFMFFDSDYYRDIAEILFWFFQWVFFLLRIDLLIYLKKAWEKNQKSEFLYFGIPFIVLLGLFIISIIVPMMGEWFDWKFATLNVFLSSYLWVYWYLIPYEVWTNPILLTKKKKILRIVFPMLPLLPGVLFFYNRIDHEFINYEKYHRHFHYIDVVEYIDPASGLFTGSKPEFNPDDSCHKGGIKVYSKVANMMNCGGDTVVTYKCKNNARVPIEIDVCGWLDLHGKYKCQSWDFLKRDDYCVAE